MHKIFDGNGILYSEYHYSLEEEYEKMIVKNSEMIFGSKGIYFDIKKRIGKPKEGAAIPDGYYLDLKFHEAPILYFVEIELRNHDVYGHIGEQILRFAISSEIGKHKIKTILINDIEKDNEKKKRLDEFFKESIKYNNINQLLDELIFDKDVAAVVVIDKRSDHLSRVLSKINIITDVIEAQTYFSKGNLLHRFTPFQDDILDTTIKNLDLEDLDTIVVPAREEGFNEVFIGEKCWYQIRISAAMLNKIKYIAAYQVAPISAITHVAEVVRIDRYKETDKYILHFAGRPHKINKITLSGSKNCRAPQAPRYTSYKKLIEASTLDDLWE